MSKQPIAALSDEERNYIAQHLIRHPNELPDNIRSDYIYSAFECWNLAKGNLQPDQPKDNRNKGFSFLSAALAQYEEALKVTFEGRSAPDAKRTFKEELGVLNRCQNVVKEFQKINDLGLTINQDHINNLIDLFHKPYGTGDLLQEVENTADIGNNTVAPLDLPRTKQGLDQAKKVVKEKLDSLENALQHPYYKFPTKILEGAISRAFNPKNKPMSPIKNKDGELVGYKIGKDKVHFNSDQYKSLMNKVVSRVEELYSVQTPERQGYILNNTDKGSLYDTLVQELVKDMQPSKGIDVETKKKWHFGGRHKEHTLTIANADNINIRGPILLWAKDKGYNTSVLSPVRPQTDRSHNTVEAVTKLIESSKQTERSGSKSIDSLPYNSAERVRAELEDAERKRIAQTPTVGEVLNQIVGLPNVLPLPGDSEERKSVYNKVTVHSEMLKAIHTVLGKEKSPQGPMSLSLMRVGDGLGEIRKTDLVAAIVNIKPEKNLHPEHVRERVEKAYQAAKESKQGVSRQ